MADGHTEAVKELLITLESTGRATNLTLSEEGLHVVSVDSTPRSWVSVILCQAPTPAHRKFPYLNVLNAQVDAASDGTVTVEIRALAVKDHEGVAIIRGTVGKDHDVSENRSWIAALLEKAYGDVKMHKRLRVLINPFAGAGKAKSRWIKQLEPIFRSAGCTLDVTFTERVGHAREICESIDIKAYDSLVLFSGDGLPHEAINGLGSRKDATRALRRLPIGVLPGGSGNALSCSLNGPKDGSSLAVSALTVLKGRPIKLDICSITQKDLRYYSFCSQSMGLMADVDLGTEHLRWMGGQRFVFGFIQRAIAGPHYECEISMRIIESDKHKLREEMVARRKDTNILAYNKEDEEAAALEEGSAAPALRFGTVENAIPPGADPEPIPGSRATGWTTVNAPICTMYAGQMPYQSPDLMQFPIADGDGTITMSILPVVSAKTLLGIMDGAEAGKHYDAKDLEYYKVEAYRLTPKPSPSKLPKFISIDGEHARYEPFQVEVHPALGRVLSLHEHWYLPPSWTA